MIQPITFAEIDLGAIAHNVKSLKNLTSEDVRFMAVVKADAYGHGAVSVAETILGNGAHELAVARFDEARALRDGGIGAPVLIFGFVPPGMVPEMLRLNLRPTINSLSQARAFSDEAGRTGQKLKAHIKIDTGMGRMGLLSQDDASNFGRILDSIQKISRLPWIETEGIYTHFANADSVDKRHTHEQLARFHRILTALKKNGYEFPLCHTANSAALIEMPESHLDMVRPGISIYGYYPGQEVNASKVYLKPVMTLKSSIIQIKDVPAGFSVSYGSTCITRKNSRIATVPLGYADGYQRLLSSKGAMLVHGIRAPIMGRVCMDLTMIDISDIESARVGDEVVAFGQQGKTQLHVDEVAGWAGTINYEIVSTINHRVPRIYLKY